MLLFTPYSDMRRFGLKYSTMRILAVVQVPTLLPEDYKVL